MSTARNFTLRLEAETIRKAKVLAAERGSSVSKLVAEYIAKMINEDQAYREAKARALSLMERGFSLGGPPYPTREELHARR